MRRVAPGSRALMRREPKSGCTTSGRGRVREERGCVILYSCAKRIAGGTAGERSRLPLLAPSPLTPFSRVEPFR